MSQVFAVRLKETLETKNMQQKAVASQLSVSPAVFSAWIRNKSEPSLDMLAQICQLLDVSAAYLIGLSDTMLPASPISIAPASVQRDLFADLTPEQRIAIEATLVAYRKLNAKSKEA